MTCPTCGNPIPKNAGALCPFCEQAITGVPRDDRVREGASRAAKGRAPGDPVVLEINLKAGMPLVDGALKRLAFGLDRARETRTHVVKVIHGYGSSGKGGAIKEAVRHRMWELERDGAVAFWVAGEDFHQGSEAAEQLVRKYPGLKQDRDWRRNNPGVTLLVLG